MYLCILNLKTLINGGVQKRYGTCVRIISISIRHNITSSEKENQIPVFPQKRTLKILIFTKCL